MAHVDINLPGGGIVDVKRIQRALDLLLRCAEVAEEYMQNISEFVAAQTEWNQKMDLAIEAIAARVQEMLAAGAGAGGVLTLEDQDALDQLLASNQARTERLEAIRAMSTVQ